MLSLILTLLGYPGGELRCNDRVDPTDIDEAERYLNLLENSPDLMRDLDPRNHCHLIKTKGDIHFRRDNHTGAIERYLESRKLAEEHNYIVDVDYIDTRLRVVRALSAQGGCTSSVAFVAVEESGEDAYSSGREGDKSESDGEEDTTDLLTPESASSEDSVMFEDIIRKLKIVPE